MATTAPFFLEQDQKVAENKLNDDDDDDDYDQHSKSQNDISIPIST